MYLTNADRSLSRHDDDSGAHSGDALLSAVTLAAAGYTVEATTAAPRQDGAFTMTLTIADAPDPPPAVVISGLADASATPAAGAATAAASDTFGVTPADATCTATPPGAAIAPAAGTSRTVTHTVAAGTTVTVTVTCTTSTSTASADARFTADAAPVPDVEIDGLDHASATPDTDAASAEVTDTFTVTPAAARCSAQATPGTPQVAPAAGASRTVTLDVAAGTTVWVIVICDHRTNRDLAAARFTAHPAPTNTDTDTTPPTATPTPPTATTPTANDDDCNDTLGTLTGTAATSGTLAATDGCTSTRHPRKTATSTYQARRHTFTLNSPGWVTITLESAATNTQRIDTYLVLLRGHTPDGTGTYITHNDDHRSRYGTHGLNSRLVDVFLQPGSYTIEATTYHAHSTTNPARTTGDYDLTVEATLTGLQASYDAIVGEELAIEFTLGGFAAAATSSSADLAVRAERTGTTGTLLVTPSRALTRSVTVAFTKPAASSSGGAQRSTRTARSAAASAWAYTFQVPAQCDRKKGHVSGPHPNGSCIWGEAALLESQDWYPRYEVAPALLNGTKRVARQALEVYRGECGMTAIQLAAWMISIGIREIPVGAMAVEKAVDLDGNPVDEYGNLVDEHGYPLDDEGNRVAGQGPRMRPVLYEIGWNKRYPARSLMTLSRFDYYDPNPQRIPARVGREDNYRLYPDNDKTWPVTRAFWHPGVGYWQLDWWPLSMGHAERSDLDKGGLEVARRLASSHCGDNSTDKSSFANYLKSQWKGCKGAEPNPCKRTYENMYLGPEPFSGIEGLYVTTASNTGHLDSDGGAQPLGMGSNGCRWGSTGDRFDCWLQDTDNPEGYIDCVDDNSDPHGCPPGEQLGGTMTKSPLAAPFISFNSGTVNNERRYAVFPASFTGDTVTWIKYAPIGTLVRSVSGNTWTRNTKTGEDKGDKLMVLVCSADAVNEDQDCSWLDSTHDRFQTLVRARYP
ncbi:hypothetical protein [Candidatus Poriferisodalis sp.]|uniref:hypothetical protein n=1 Tax=Candidatus Poriferisodalis sp. TaxID=3101277 RepID=UPI003AF641BB